MWAARGIKRRGQKRQVVRDGEAVPELVARHCRPACPVSGGGQGTARAPWSARRWVAARREEGLTGEQVGGWRAWGAAALDAAGNVAAVLRAARGSAAVTGRRGAAGAPPLRV